MNPLPNAWLAYCGPMIIFGLFTAAEGWLPPALYPVAYGTKMAAVTAGLVHWRRPLRDIRPSWAMVLPSVFVGLFIVGAWLVIDKAVAYPHLGTRIGFDPSHLQLTSSRLAFLAVRLYGLVLVVPVMEELFWRSFLLRYASRVDFLSLPMGTFSLSALAIMVTFSAVAHTEWLVAAGASIVLALWLRRTGSLFAAVVAHAVANGALGFYVLISHDWKYW
jgi:CAAX prenyl protease-like protein